jgi:hypothetical protein
MNPLTESRNTEREGRVETVSAQERGVGKDPKKNRKF